MGFSRELVFHLVQKRVLWVTLATVISPSLMRAQSGPVATVDQATMQALLKRIDQLETRVQQLEAAQHAAASESAKVEARQQLSVDPPSHGPSPQASQEHEPDSGEHSESERMDVSKTLLRIRGFGDVNFHGDNYHPPNAPGDKTAFTLGQLNLFVTSDISDKFKFLGEIVFEAGPDNIYGVTRGTANSFGVDVERYLLTYSQNEYFNLSAGRYHTAIGYYNTAFHHSTWLQTTTGRPLLFEFEDKGGILPIHNIGVEAYGSLPSGSLGLHYVAEVGNGRASRIPLDDEPVQNIVDESNHKAVNFELFARPTKVPGLQLGVSVYRDKLLPITELIPVGETILAAHAIYSSSNFEWLNEGLVVRHTPEGGHTYQTPGWYSQISRRFGQYRPYFRYQYINASPNEPIFPDIGLRAGPSAGIRYDASESVALKLQYDYTSLRNQPAVQGLQAQVGFTF
jgi:outer membrane murein-binding lipoprotein Lpp